MSTLKDIASLAGVSITTVSHVLNGTRFVSEELRKSVMDAVDQLQYRPNRIAQSLRKQQSRTIGFVAPLLATESTNSFCVKSLRGVCAVLNDDRYSVILGDNSKCSSSEKECELLCEFRSQMVDGLIVLPTEHFMDYAELKTLMGKNFPIVFIDEQTDGIYDAVLVESEEGIYQVTRQIIGEGHKKIGVLMGNGRKHCLRYNGYRKALKENGIPFEERLVGAADASEESGRCKMEELIRNNPDMTAVLMISNVMAIGAVTYINEHHIHMPQELAVVVLDDYTWSRLTIPPLTVIEQPAYQAGSAAASILIDRIENPDKPIVIHREPLEFIRRQSF